MLQLKPGLKNAVRRPLIGDELSDGPPQAVVQAAAFPFSEAIPVYLKSQKKFRRPFNHQFLTHGTNRLLNKYYPRGARPSPNRRNLEALMLKGLRDVILGFPRAGELTDIREYWAYKMSDYLVEKMVDEHRVQFPRLGEFLKKSLFGDPRRLKYYKNMVRKWKEGSRARKPEVIKWLKREYKPALEFLKRSFRDKNFFLQMNTGVRMSRDNRITNVRKTSALLNLVYDILGTELGPEMRLKLENDQKVIKKRSGSRKVISFVVKDYPKFNENRALTSICKKHFKSIYCTPKEKTKKKKQETINTGIKNAVAFYNRKFFTLVPEKNRKEIILPYAKIEHDKRVKGLASKALVSGHLKFMEDLQNVFGSCAVDLASRKPLSDILLAQKELDDKIKEPVEAELAKDLGTNEEGKDSMEAKPSLDEEALATKQGEVAVVAEEAGTAGPRWDSGLMKKASYVIIRVLRDMATTRLLSTADAWSEIESEKDRSSETDADSVVAQLTPMVALRSLLAEETSQKVLLPTLRHLKASTKRMYKNIKSKQKSLILDRFKEFNKAFAKQSGISTSDKDIAAMLSEWEQEVSNEESDDTLATSDSQKSVVYGVEKSIFDYRGLHNSNKKTVHIDLLCLLLLTLSVSDKIIAMREVAREYSDTQLRRTNQCEKTCDGRSKTKNISLPHFLEFLRKSEAGVDVETCLAVAQRYCPEYVFYEKKGELAAVVVAAGSEDDELAPKEEKEPVGGGEPLSEGSSQEQSSPVDQTLLSRTSSVHEGPCPAKLEEDKSYMSYKEPAWREDQPRLYLVKLTAEWDVFRDTAEVGVPQQYVSTEFFEFPSAMGLPRLVSRYWRELDPPRSRPVYILDPAPRSLHWDYNNWLKEGLKLAPYERGDEDLPWMTRYFTTFWVGSEGCPPWEGVQEAILASWCGDLECTLDRSAVFFGKFSEAVEEFEKAHGKTRRIYDTSEQRPGQRWKWYKVNDHLEKSTTVEVLGVGGWQQKLSDIYRDVESGGSGSSLLSRMSAVQSHTSIRPRPSLVMSQTEIMNVGREDEKAEAASGFPLRDQKSLKEALDNWTEKTKDFVARRVAPFGKRYRPITEHYLRQLNQEFGFVYTNRLPERHPNARKAPPRAIYYSDKEKQFYHHSNNFIHYFQRKYPGRFLKMPYHVKNEYGSMKHVSTFICPRRLSWEKMGTWKGCTRCVCNKLELVPLKDPTRPPKMLKSPFTTLSDRKGNVFDLCTVLVGFLIGAGYDAYCVCGTATYHRALYRNTEDVSPDQSDLEPPSTNRYKQYNLLPPFKSYWFRKSVAFKDPLPYEKMEICKVTRSGRERARRERDSWPTSEKGLIALYNKEGVRKVRHRSRYDNPSLPLHRTEGSRRAVRQVTSGQGVTTNLAHLYDQLVQELRRRTDQESRTHHVSSIKSYIHEPMVQLKSDYAQLRAVKQREDRERRRGRGAHLTEEEEYFNWLYGPKGTHKDFYQMIKKEEERCNRERIGDPVDLLDFLEVYDPDKDRLETPTGQLQHLLRQENIRCKRKLKQRKELREAIDRYKASKVKTKKYQERMIRLGRVLKERDPYGFALLEEMLNIPDEARNLKEADLKSHKYKLRHSPFLAKLLYKIQESYDNSSIFKRMVEKLGFKIDKDINVVPPKERILREGVVNLGQYLEGRVRQAGRGRVWRAREGRVLARRPFRPSRLHCWVLVRTGQRGVTQPFFIDLLTGCHYPVSDSNYLKISCVWNHLNYYIPRYISTSHAPTRKFELYDLGVWFHLLPLEPVQEAVELKKKPWWWEARGHPHQLQHLRMPPHWGRRPRFPPLEWDKKFATSNKKTFNYKKTTIEAYDPRCRPTDGLLKRITRFFDMRKTAMREVSALFGLREDRLAWRSVDVRSGFVEERFEQGRPDSLRIMRYLAYLKPGLYTPKELRFYGKWRKDRLDSILITKRFLVAEFRSGREDHLKRIKIHYSSRQSGRRHLVIDENSNYVKRVRARFRKLSPDYEVWSKSLPELFGNIPRKLDLNMAHRYSEYWYWDKALGSEVKWVSSHADGNLGLLLSSGELDRSPLLNRKPVIYGVTKDLEEGPRQDTLRRETYARREQRDRTYLMTVAKELEQVVVDTVILREYEKIMDVLRVTDELKKVNLTSEKALHTMKKYFEVERETLARDYEKMSCSKTMLDLWTCDQGTLTGRLLNFFIQERVWLYFVLAGWSDMNKLFRAIAREKEGETPMFSGYTDLLRTLLDALNQGFRAREEVPLPPRRDLDMWPLQVNVPLNAGIERLEGLASGLRRPEEGRTVKDGGKSRTTNLKSARFEGSTVVVRSRADGHSSAIGPEICGSTTHSEKRNQSIRKTINVNEDVNGLKTIKKIKNKLPNKKVMSISSQSNVIITQDEKSYSEQELNQLCKSNMASVEDSDFGTIRKVSIHRTSMNSNFSSYPENNCGVDGLRKDCRTKKAKKTKKITRYHRKLMYKLSSTNVMNEIQNSVKVRACNELQKSMKNHSFVCREIEYIKKEKNKSETSSLLSRERESKTNKEVDIIITKKVSKIRKEKKEIHDQSISFDQPFKAKNGLKKVSFKWEDSSLPSSVSILEEDDIKVTLENLRDVKRKMLYFDEISSYTSLSSKSIKFHSKSKKPGSKMSKLRNTTSIQLRPVMDNAENKKHLREQRKTSRQYWKFNEKSKIDSSAKRNIDDRNNFSDKSRTELKFRIVDLSKDGRGHMPTYPSEKEKTLKKNTRGITKMIFKNNSETPSEISCNNLLKKERSHNSVDLEINKCLSTKNKEVRANLFMSASERYLSDRSRDECGISNEGLPQISNNYCSEAEGGRQLMDGSFTVKDGTKNKAVSKDPSNRKCLESRPHCRITEKENANLKKMFFQILKVIAPIQMNQLFGTHGGSSGNGIMKLSWNEQFVDLYNKFIDNVTAARTSKPKDEDAILEFVDYQHPFEYQVKPVDHAIEAFKNVAPSKRLSMDELDVLIKVAEKRARREQLEEEEKTKVTEIVDSRRAQPDAKIAEVRKTQAFINSIVGPISSSHGPLLKKKKRAAAPSVCFAFEEVQGIIEKGNSGTSEDFRDKGTDCYELFFRKTKKSSKCSKSLQDYMDELESKPRISLLLSDTSDLKCVETEAFSCALNKGRYYQYDGSERAFQMTGSSSNQKVVEKEFDLFDKSSRFPIMKKVKTKLDSPTLPIKINIDFGVVEVINLFSKPSEREFISVEDEMLVKLEPIPKEEEVVMFDTETIKTLRRIYPIDYSTLELYDEEIPEDGILDFAEDKKGGTEGRRTSVTRVVANHGRLRRAVGSCPHCINYLFAAHKERQALLRTVECLRDESAARAMSRVAGQPLAEPVLAAHRRAVRTFGEYAAFLRAARLSYRDKEAAEECASFRHFLELLNYKVAFDMLGLEAAAQRLEAAWPRAETPIPYYHSRRPSASRVSLSSLPAATRPVPTPSRPADLELYLRHRKDMSEQQPPQPKTAYTFVTKKVQLK